MLIFRLVMNFVRPKTLRSALCMALPHLTVARRLLEIVTKVTNLETVKIEFSSSSFPSSYSPPLPPPPPLPLLLSLLLLLLQCIYASSAETKTPTNNRQILLAGAF